MAAKPPVEFVRDGITFGALGFGALAMVAPQGFASMYGLRRDGQLLTMIRLWGTRTAALGAMNYLTKDSKLRKSFLLIAAGVNAADAVFVASAGSDLSVRTRVSGAVTSATFGAAAGYVAAAT